MKRHPQTPLVKPRRPFHLPPNRTHKNKRDLVERQKHKNADYRE